MLPNLDKNKCIRISDITLISPIYMDVREIWNMNVTTSGVVRRSAALGENKKCRPCLICYLVICSMIWLFWLIMYFACPKFEFGSSEIRSFVLHYFTNHWHFLYLSLNHPSTVEPSHTLGNFKFNTPPQPFQFIPWHTWHTCLTHLANSFLKFFNDKIERICSKFFSSDSPIPIFFQSLLHIYLISI